MYIQVRHTFTVAAIAAIAGCSGVASTQTGLPGSQVGMASVHPGAQAVPFAHRNVATQVSRAATYPTGASLVFVAEPTGKGYVNIYQTAKLSSNPAPIATIQLPYRGSPYGLAIDQTGTLYVSDAGNNAVDIYPKGSTTMKSSITDGISHPIGLAIDGNGTLYVVNQVPGQSSITEYAQGSSTPSKTITGGGMVAPEYLTVDKTGNLYISDGNADSNVGAIFKLPAGGSSITDLHLTGINGPLGVAISPKTGDLWEADAGGNVINIFNLAKGKKPIRTIPGSGFPYGLSIQNNGRPVGDVVVSDLSTNSIYAYKPGQYTSYATLTNGVSSPTGVLIAKP